MKGRTDVDQNITLRDVAHAAGVGLATASRALRDDPSAAATTRDKVKQVAHKLGYRPDPALHSLIERRWRGRRRGGDLNLGYVFDSRSIFADMADFQFRRFKKMAEARGYCLIREDLADFRNTSDLMRRLHAQGISGILVSLLTEVSYPLDGLFASYPAVSINVASYQPNCPIVMQDEFVSIGEVWSQLIQSGYQRIGVLLKAHPNSISVQQRKGAILCQQLNCPQESDRIPFFSFSDFNEEERHGLKRWLERYRPDVILGNAHNESWVLNELGYRIPEDIAFAAANLWDINKLGVIAGYFRDNGLIFERGLHLLKMMIGSGSAGAKHSSLMELVKGEWSPGDSLPQRVDKTGRLSPREKKPTITLVT